MDRIEAVVKFPNDYDEFEIMLKSNVTRFVFFFGLALVGLVFFLSWIPDPALTKVPYLPREIAVWADRHVILRTGIAMLPLGVLLGIWLTAESRRRQDWIVAWFALTGVVVLAELGQLAIPRRVCDGKDILCGIVGVSIGLGVSRWVYWLLKYVKSVLCV
jgi:VanZ like family